jgi:hypothetical protein
VAAEPVSVLLVNPKFASGASPVSLSMTFYLSDGSRVPWKGNTSDIRRDYPDLNILLVDKAWDPTVN